MADENQSGICCMTTLLTLTCHDQSARPQLCVVVAGLRLTGMNDRTGGPDVRARVACDRYLGRVSNECSLFFLFFFFLRWSRVPKYRCLLCFTGFFNSREPSRGNPHLCGNKKKRFRMVEEKYVPWDLICRCCPALAGYLVM